MGIKDFQFRSVRQFAFAMAALGFVGGWLAHAYLGTWAAGIGTALQAAFE